MYTALRRSAEWVAQALALFGGAILLIIIVLTCVSIAGRAAIPLNIGVGPILGIYDLTEIGMAAAVFAFLPLCQLRQAHAQVDLLEPAFSDTVNRLLNLLFNVAMFAAAAFGTWRLYLGMLDKLRFGETTLIAQIPVWQGYAASMLGAAGFVFVAAFCVIRSTRHLILKTEDTPSHV